MQSRFFVKYNLVFKSILFLCCMCFPVLRWQWGTYNFFHCMFFYNALFSLLLLIWLPCNLLTKGGKWYWAWFSLRFLGLNRVSPLPENTDTCNSCHKGRTMDLRYSEDGRVEFETDKGSVARVSVYARDMLFEDSNARNAAVLTDTLLPDICRVLLVCSSIVLCFAADAILDNYYDAMIIDGTQRILFSFSACSWVMLLTFAVSFEPKWFS